MQARAVEFFTSCKINLVGLGFNTIFELSIVYASRCLFDNCKSQLEFRQWLKRSLVKGTLPKTNAGCCLLFHKLALFNDSTGN
jgi:hypothetical protein